MMKKAAVIAATIFVLLLAGMAQAGVSIVLNGSFEDDGGIDNITEQEPNNWDVNVPPNQFGGWVYDDWVTEGSYNLTLFSNAYKAFEVNDIATVSQMVYLTDVNEIVFDLNLDTQSSGKIWDPNKRTAVVMIDDVVVWKSNSVGTDVRGEYLNQFADIDIDDLALHKLSLGIKADVNETTTDIKYYTDWDFVRFNFYCGGNGFLPGDFSRDCCVDMNDLEILAGLWLDEVDSYHKCNLVADEPAPYGIIDFRDFAIFADGWDCNMVALEMFTDVWLEMVDADNEYNLFHGDDIDPNGIIDFRDFAGFADDWLQCSW